jgi:uncharacterized NAD-dependent epimerase/dehydratase family protein
MMGKRRHLAILAEGRFTALDAKTAVGVLRYRPEEVAAVVDSSHAGRTCDACVGVGGAIPVVTDLEAAAAQGADSLLIGVAPQGGDLPREWRGTVESALRRGWDVLSGLHVFLADDPALEAMASRHGARILDVRRPPEERPIAARRAASLDALVVLTVGSDCNVGKMTAALELTRALEARGTRAAFVATGQTGIVIADHGVAVDAVTSDFAAGMVEEQVMDAASNADVVVVEGQGALHHPGYSGVTLALLHGCCPRAMVLCHQAGRERVRVPGHRTSVDEESQPWIPPLGELARSYEIAASWVSPGRVVAVALNTLGLEEREARAAVRDAAAATGLPATDPVRFGAEPIADAVEAERRAGRERAPLA